MSTLQKQSRLQMVWACFARPALLLPILFVGLPVSAQPAEPDQEQQGPTIEDTRALLETWIELRKTISKTKNDWRLSKELLYDRIAVMKDEIERLRDEIAKKREELSGFDASIEVMEAEEKILIEAADKLASMVERLEARTVALVEQAPAPLASQVRPIAAQIPGYVPPGKKETPSESASPALEQGGDPQADAEKADDAKNLPPLSRRMDNAIGVLYLFNKSANKIQQTSELVDQADGSKLTVDTVYLGLSYAYYVDDSSTVGGFGWGAPGGWQWHTIDQAGVAAAVRQAVKVFNDDMPAAYVGLPVEVK